MLLSPTKKIVVRWPARLHSNCTLLERVPVRPTRLSTACRVSTATATIRARPCAEGKVLSAHTDMVLIDCASSGALVSAMECLFRFEDRALSPPMALITAEEACIVDSAALPAVLIHDDCRRVEE